jgi:DNA-directed RNA polymerase subunit M/transcription elongation factor TFIIS
MVKNDKPIVCHKCGNDMFVIKESILGISIRCSSCGEGKIFGPDISARTIISILKEKDLKIDGTLKNVEISPEFIEFMKEKKTKPKDDLHD